MNTATCSQEKNCEHGELFKLMEEKDGRRPS